MANILVVSNSQQAGEEIARYLEEGGHVVAGQLSRKTALFYADLYPAQLAVIDDYGCSDAQRGEVVDYLKSLGVLVITLKSFPYQVELGDVTLPRVWSGSELLDTVDELLTKAGS